MNVSDIMTANPITLHQDQSLRTALEIMTTHGIHHLPILNAERQLVGIVTRRDCRAALKAPSILQENWKDDDRITRMPVRAIMTPAPIVIEPDADADDAVSLMLAHHVSCLPVVRSETLVGIVTTSDILVAFRVLYRQAREVSDQTL